MSKKRFVIFGGGISGLTTAYFLKEKITKLNSNHEIILLEQESKIGGNIQSIRDSGFIFDTGPRGFLAEGRRTLSLCKDIGIWNKIQVSNDNARIRYIWTNNKLNPLPNGIIDLIRSDVIGLKEVKTVIAEIFKRNMPISDDESVAQFFTRRFSEDMLNNLFELLVTGIYAGNTKTLSAKAIFPKLTELEHKYGSIILGFLKAKKNSVKNQFPDDVMAINKRKLVAFDSGMEVLIKALGENLNTIIKTNVKINEISFRDNIIHCEYDGAKQKINADYIIFATPAYHTANLINPLSSELYSLLNKVEYAPIQVLCLGYNKKVNPYKGFGFLSPQKEKLSMLGCIWNDMVFPTLAPKNGVNLTAIYGGACHPETKNWTDEQLINNAQNTIKLTMNIKDKPDIIHIIRYDKGIPQYNVGHIKLVKNIFNIINEHPSIFINSSYINGVGINDCIKNSYELVKKMDLFIK